MTEQTDWMIAVEYKIDIVRCIDEVINGENEATHWLLLYQKLWQTAQLK
jgi:hypothetical protein